MTREEQITFKAGSIADGCIAHGAPWEDYYQGFIEGAKWADTNPPQLSLPSDIDEVAEEYANSHYGEFLEIGYEFGEPIETTVDDKPFVRDAFKAGAEWILSQIKLA